MVIDSIITHNFIYIICFFKLKTQIKTFQYHNNCKCFMLTVPTYYIIIPRLYYIILDTFY